MPRIRGKSSYWDNPNQSAPEQEPAPVRNQPKNLTRNDQTMEYYGAQQQPYRQQFQQPATGYTVPQKINVVTQVVSDYDPNNVTMAKTIVQPIAIVPYNTTEQPLYQYAPNNGAYDNYQDGYDDGQQLDYGNGQQGGYDDNYGGYGDYNQPRGKALGRNNAKSSVNALKIVLLILSLLSIAVIVLGKFIDLVYLKFYAASSGLEIILTGITGIMNGGFVIKEMLLPLTLALTSLITVLILLDSLFGIKKGVCIFEKILAVLGLISAGVFVYMLYSKQLTIGYGSYIFAGISALTALLAICGKRRR